MHVVAEIGGKRIALRSLADVQQALDRQQLRHQAQLLRARKEGLPLPPLYQAGVRYRPEPLGREHWQDPEETVRLGYGDCEDLAPWRAAELTLAGVPARATAVRGGPRTVHVIVVRRADGLREDPSYRLGMRTV